MGFTWDSENLEHDKMRARQAWERAADVIRRGDHRLVVLDELTYLCSWGWVGADEVTNVVRDRPRHVSVVITGRDADPRLVAIADTASEVRSIHHAYDRGIAAMRGIDF
jgi:cob(I)alamin adenosyltransferase